MVVTENSVWSQWHQQPNHQGWSQWRITGSPKNYSGIRVCRDVALESALEASSWDRFKFENSLRANPCMPPELLTVRHALSSHHLCWTLENSQDTTHLIKQYASSKIPVSQISSFNLKTTVYSVTALLKWTPYLWLCLCCQPVQTSSLWYHSISLQHLKQRIFSPIVHPNPHLKLDD